MKVSDFHFDLPDELIARYPLPERTASRLLHLEGSSGAVHHRQFRDIESLLQPGDLLVFNDTRVIPARLPATKASGGKAEILVERVLDEQCILAHVRASRSPKAEQRLILENGAGVRVLGRQGEFFHLAFETDAPALEVIEAIGHMPLPPYVDRPDEAMDRERYQTVFGVKPGAVAAPTAGLHFDEALIERLQEKGVETTSVTLHVGAGTFQPVRVDNIQEHEMHGEVLSVSEEAVSAVRHAKQRGGRVVAVGTTAVRALESAVVEGAFSAQSGETRIFIYPGYRFQVVDALITNFHLPESTLIMLVSAFAGREQTLAAYHEAVAQRYRFFSYGDAMFITPSEQARPDGSAIQ